LNIDGQIDAPGIGGLKRVRAKRARRESDTATDSGSDENTVGVETLKKINNTEATS